MTECRPSARIEGAMVRDLVEPSQYQPGCIVSRPLLQHETGSPAVFSFNVEHAPSAHTVPFNAFAQVLDGQAEIVVPGKPGAVRAGGVQHAGRVARRRMALLTMFKTKSA